MLFSLRSFQAATTVLSLVALGACSSSKKDDVAPTTPVGLSWTVDGAAVSTTTVQSQKGGSTVSIAGTATSGGGTVSYLSLQIPNAMGTYAFSSSALASGTYSFTLGTTTAVYYAGTLPAAAGMYTLGAGTIVVTALTATNVTGTFSFTGIGPAGAGKAITNGTFNVGL